MKNSRTSLTHITNKVFSFKQLWQVKLFSVTKKKKKKMHSCCPSFFFGWETSKKIYSKLVKEITSWIKACSMKQGFSSIQTVKSAMLEACFAKMCAGIFPCLLV